MNPYIVPILYLVAALLMVFLLVALERHKKPKSDRELHFDEGETKKERRRRFIDSQ